MGTPKSSLYRWIFPYKPSIFGYPHLWKPPYTFTLTPMKEEPAPGAGLPAPETMFYREKHVFGTIQWG